MRCKVPNGGIDGDHTELYIQSLHNDFQSHSVNLWFKSIVEIYSVYPLIGDVRGGTMITIYGNSFIRSPDIRCRFNHIFVSAVFIDNNTVSCETPQYSYAPALVDFAVEIDKYHYDTTWNNSFLFYKHPIIYSINPVRGYVDGGINITIHGDNFLFDNSNVEPICRFGDDETVYQNATIINSTAMICQVPPYNAGFVSVEISMNNGYDWSDSGILYEYMTIPSIINSEIYPSIGPKSGSTNITITAEDLRTELVHYCVFDGSINTTANVVSESEIKLSFVVLFFFFLLVLLMKMIYSAVNSIMEILDDELYKVWMLNQK